MQNVKGNKDFFERKQELGSKLQSVLHEVSELYGISVDREEGSIRRTLDLEAIVPLLRERESVTQRRTHAVVIAEGAGRGDDALRTIAYLQSEGINVSLGLEADDVGNAGVRFAILIGDEERDQDQVRLKDMADRSERLMGVEEALYILEKYS